MRVQPAATTHAITIIAGTNGRRISALLAGTALALIFAGMPPAAAQVCDVTGCSGTFTGPQSITIAGSTYAVNGATINTATASALSILATNSAGLEVDFSGANGLHTTDPSAPNGGFSLIGNANPVSANVLSGTSTFSGSSASFGAFVTSGAMAAFSSATGSTVAFDGDGNGPDLEVYSSGGAAAISFAGTANASSIAADLGGTGILLVGDTGATLTLTSGTISILGDSTAVGNFGIYVQTDAAGAAGTISLGATNVAVTGDNSAAIYLVPQGDATLTLGSGAISVSPNSNPGLDGTGGSYGLYIKPAAGNIIVSQGTGAPGSINITNDTGGSAYGIYGIANGSHSVAIDAADSITATTTGVGYGIYANSNIGAISIGGGGGITGAISAQTGIYTGSNGGSIAIATEAGGTIDAVDAGIYASSSGSAVNSGNVSVTVGAAIGAVSAPTDGVFASVGGAGDTGSVTVNSSAAINAGNVGILAQSATGEIVIGNLGAGLGGVLNAGTGATIGIDALNAGGAIQITTSAAATIDAGSYGIEAESDGSSTANGNILINAHGAIGTTITPDFGISAIIGNSDDLGAVTVNTTAAINAGSHGIFATNNGGALSITTEAGGTISAANFGIYAVSTGSVAANDPVTISVGDTIGATTAPITGVYAVVAGAGDTGSVTVNANANITAAATAIDAESVSGLVTVNVQSGATLSAPTGDAIYTTSISGSASINISGKVMGDVVGTNGDDNFVFTSSANPNDSVVIGQVNGNGGNDTLTLNGTSTGAIQSLNSLVGIGSIIKSDSGTWILTGTATNDPGYEISTGTLQLGDGTTNANIGTGIMLDNANLAIDATGAQTLNNNIVTDLGSIGNVTIMGGTVTLGGVNSYTGATTVNSGATLILGSSTALGIFGADTINGTLDVNGFDTNLFSLAGTGTVTNNGASPVTITTIGNNLFQGVIQDGSAPIAVLTTAGENIGLSGNNTFSGGLTIVAGSIVNVGDGGPTGAIGTGVVTDNGLLSFDISADNTYANTITGTGTVNVINSGTAILTANNSYGDTQIFGTLQVGNGGTTGSMGTGAVLDDGILAYDHSDNLTLPAGITGTGGISQMGGGILLVTSAEAFTGTNSVSNGILEVGDAAHPGASLAGGVTVTGGTLEGHGTVNGDVAVASGGTLRPGGTIGTLTVNGAVSIPAGATFTEEFSNSAASKLSVSGAVTLGGNLVLVSDSTTYTSNTVYQIITGSSVSGTFASVSGAPAGNPTTLQYSATVVDLIVDSTAPPTPMTTTFLFNSYGRTPNQIAAGAALTASSPSAPLYTAIGGVVTANTAAVPTTLGQLAGDIHPSLRSAAIEDARMVRDAMLGHMNHNPDGPTLWAAGFGSTGTISDNNAANLSHRTDGFLAGGDLPVVGDAMRLGVSGGYSADNTHTAGHFSTASGNEGHIGAYITFDEDHLHLNVGGDYAFGSVNVKRSVSTLGAVLSDHQGQHGDQVFADIGYRLTDTPLGLPLEPYAGIAKVSSGQGFFRETGGIAALSGAAASDSETFTTIGLRGAFDDAIAMGSAGITPRFDLGWQHALDQLTPAQLVTFQNTGQNFLVMGVPLSRDAASVQAGFEMKQGPATFFLTYDGNFASRLSDNGLSAGLDWQF